MSFMLQKLNNIRVLRAMAREYPIDVLEEALEKFKIVTGERRNEVAELEQNQAEKQEKINIWLEMMQADGISPEELMPRGEITAGTSKKRAARPAKYRFIDEHGQQKTWTGQGRTPKPIALALSAGKTLEDFLI